MFELFLGSILTDNPEAIKFIVLGLLGIVVITTIVKKLFKLALILTLVAILANYLVPDLVATLAQP